MNLEYTLKDIEVKLHDVRRQLEGLLQLLKMGIPVPEEDLVKLQSQASELNRMSLNLYIAAKRGALQEAEEITITPPESNVVTFPGGDKKE